MAREHFLRMNVETDAADARRGPGEIMIDDVFRIPSASKTWAPR